MAHVVEELLTRDAARLGDGALRSIPPGIGHPATVERQSSSTTISAARSLQLSIIPVLYPATPLKRRGGSCPGILYSGTAKKIHRSITTTFSAPGHCALQDFSPADQLSCPPPPIRLRLDHLHSGAFIAEAAEAKHYDFHQSSSVHPGLQPPTLTELGQPPRSPRSPRSPLSTAFGRIRPRRPRSLVAILIATPPGSACPAKWEGNCKTAPSSIQQWLDCCSPPQSARRNDSRTIWQRNLDLWTSTTTD